MRTPRTIEVVTVVAAAMTSAAVADITITQAASGTTYSTTLNFDEAGGPVGSGLANDAFASTGLADMAAGDGNNVVGDFVEPWIGTDNAFFGNFGIFMTFDTDLTSFSAQVWDPSGPPGPIGGGLGIFVFNDGTEVANSFITPSWGFVGDEWIDISATDGMVFDEIRLVGFGFTATTYADNLSWNAVPAPSGLALIGLTGCIAGRRRRTK